MVIGSELFKPFLWVWIQHKYVKKREANKTAEWLILLKINILLLEILHGWVTYHSGSVVHWRKTYQTKKRHVWPLVHSVTGNDTILGMEYNERKKGKEYCKFWKNVFSKWPM